MTADERAEALRLVCGIALQWAGEYGWSPAMRPEAERVIAAVRVLSPEQVDEAMEGL